MSSREKDDFSFIPDLYVMAGIFASLIVNQLLLHRPLIELQGILSVPAYIGVAFILSCARWLNLKETRQLFPIGDKLIESPNPWFLYTRIALKEAAIFGVGMLAPMIGWSVAVGTLGTSFMNKLRTGRS
jgi:hypothetical protein